MDKNLMDALYVEHDGKIGVLSSDERKVVSQVIGTDLTLVYDKKEGNTYLLIPLTRNHNGLRVTKKRYLRERKK